MAEGSSSPTAMLAAVDKREVKLVGAKAPTDVARVAKMAVATFMVTTNQMKDLWCWHHQLESALFRFSLMDGQQFRRQGSRLRHSLLGCFRG